MVKTLSNINILVNYWYRSFGWIVLNSFAISTPWIEFSIFVDLFNLVVFRQNNLQWYVKTLLPRPIFASRFSHNGLLIYHILYQHARDTSSLLVVLYTSHSMFLFIFSIWRRWWTELESFKSWIIRYSLLWISTWKRQTVRACQWSTLDVSSRRYSSLEPASVKPAFRLHCRFQVSISAHTTHLPAGSLLCQNLWLIGRRFCLKFRAAKIGCSTTCPRPICDCLLFPTKFWNIFELPSNTACHYIYGFINRCRHLYAVNMLPACISFAYTPQPRNLRVRYRS